MLICMVAAPCVANFFPLTERQKHIAHFGVPVASGLAFQFVAAGFKQRTIALPAAGIVTVAAALAAFIKYDPLGRI